MNTGLTIAFICLGKKHDTIENYNKFGDKYWDDTQHNNSKIGYYFAYYYQQKYVYIHKIINILQTCNRPSIMNEWTKDRQILCLSNQLKKFTWDEWTKGIGLGAPYTPSYRMAPTCSWSYTELKNHKDFKEFNFINFMNAIENQPTPVIIKYNDDNDDDDAELKAVILEYELKKKEIYTRKLEKNIGSLQIKRRETLILKRNEYEKKMEAIKLKILKINAEIEAVMCGKRNDDIIKEEKEKMNNL